MCAVFILLLYFSASANRHIKAKLFREEFNLHMRSNKVKGASAVEYFIVVILLISFLVIGVVFAEHGTGEPLPLVIIPEGKIAKWKTELAITTPITKNEISRRIS